MSKRQFAILVVVALVLTAFSAVLSRWDSPDWRSITSRRIFTFPWRETARLKVWRADGEILEFAREQGREWQIRVGDGLWDSVNPQAMEEFAALIMLPWRDPKPDLPPPSPESLPKLAAESFDGDRVELTFGDASGGLRAVSAADEPDATFGLPLDLAKVMDWPSARFRNLFLTNTPPGARIARLVLFPGGNDPALKIEMQRDAGGWRMTAPVSWPCEAVRMDQLVGWLDRFQADSIVANQADDPEEYGFTPDSAFIEVYYEMGETKASRRVELGKKQDDDVFARTKGREAVFKVSLRHLDEIAIRQAESNPGEWMSFFRKRSLDVIGAPLLSRLVVERLLPNPERLVLERAGGMGDAAWSGTLEKSGNAATFAVDAPTEADPGRPLSALLNGLTNLRVRSFLAEGVPGQDTIKWTAFPAWRFTAFGADGAALPALTLYALDAEGAMQPGKPYLEGDSGPAPMVPPEGAAGRQGIAASVEDKPAIVELPGESAYFLCLPLYRYRSKRLLDLDPDAWTRVTVEKGGKRTVYVRGEREYGDQWWLDGSPPRPLLDDNNLFATLLLELSQLQASGWVAETADRPAEFGLDRPEITMIVYGAPDPPEEGKSPADGQELFTLSLGGAAGENGRYARLDDSGVVFLLTDETAARLERDYH